MPHAATMDDELFRALRDDAGMPEAAAAKVAQLIFRQGESAARAGRETEREAARAEREAERAADREAFAAKGDVTVLQTKAENTDSAIDRIDQTLLRMDERFERIDATLASMKEMIARLDERITGMQAQNDERINSMQAQNDKFFYIFFSLHVVTITALVGLLTKGIIWGVAP